MKQNKKYKNLIVYYFSGTGNSKSAANWIVDEAKKNNIDTKLVNIEDSDEKGFDYEEDTLVGFCFPTHGFNVPPIMMNFMFKLKVDKRCDTFIINTRGGAKIGNKFTPGFTGIAQIFAALILFIKGFKIVGMQPLDLPSNWLFLHPAAKPKVVLSIFHHAKEIVSVFAQKIFSGKSLYKALYTLPFDILLIPISFLYYIVGRFYLAKSLVANHKCNNCGLCEKSCPVNAIKTINNRPFWTYKCEGCMRCANICSKRAIETTHTFSVLLILISSFVLSPLFMLMFDKLGVLEYIEENIFFSTIWFFIKAFIFILFVFLSYRILHFVMRWKPIQIIVAYSSLSFYKFWRRYKIPKM